MFRRGIVLDISTAFGELCHVYYISLANYRCRVVGIDGTGIYMCICICINRELGNADDSESIVERDKKAIPMWFLSYLILVGLN